MSKLAQELKSRTILQGDVLDKLKEIPDESIDCIISSPPYWGLRDYKVEGQIGLEPDFREFLKTMQKVMNECRRVLKPSGSCWVNFGDTYSGGQSHSDWFHVDERFSSSQMKNAKFKGPRKNQIQAKSLMGIPARFYIQCIDDGWIARNHIPWYKSNSMPSSVKDRFTNKWESIFFFAKKQKYYFNLDAVREKTITKSKPFNLRVREIKRGHEQAKLTGGMSEKEDQEYDSRGEIKEKYSDNPQSNVARPHKDRLGNPDKTYAGFNEQRKSKQHENTPTSQNQLNQRIAHARSILGMPHDNPFGNSKGKNPGDFFFEDKPKLYHNTQKYIKNEDFFQIINNQHNAYWLGFLFADGYVGERVTILALQDNDVYHLEKLRDIICDEIPIKRNGNGLGLQIYSTKISNILKNYGMDTKKEIKNIPKELESHFIRGLFDGDGSIHFSVRPNGYRDFGWSLMGKYELLEWVQERLIKNCNLEKTEIRTYRNISELRYGGNLQVRRIGQYLYKNAQVMLDRKYHKFQELNENNSEDIFFINPKPFPEAHFATFPIELPLKILKCSCPQDGIALDPFFGAGTTAVAAEKLGLRWIGIELNEEYIKIARKRLEPYLNDKLGVFC